MKFIFILFFFLLMLGCQDILDNTDRNLNDSNIKLSQIVKNYIDMNLSSDGFLHAYGTDKLSTRDSMIAALFWAEKGEYEKVEKILLTILPLQYTGPVQRHFGNFPTLKGDEPPLDYNWSAFIGAYLSYLIQEHGSNLSDSLNQKIEIVIKRAAYHRLAQLWNRPDTTNINILSAYFLLQAGKILNDKNMRYEAENFWKHFYEQSITEGFREYNGLSYISVHLYGLDFIQKHEHGKIAEQASELSQLLLWNLARRYNYELNQLAGPFSRTPELSLMDKNYHTLQAIMYKASKGRIELLDHSPNNSGPLHATFPLIMDIEFPKEWIESVIEGANYNKHFRETVQEADNINMGYKQTTSFISNKWVLGSINYDHIRRFKRQVNRPLIFHTRSSEFKLVTTVKPESDGYDFYSVQNKGSILVDVHKIGDDLFSLYFDLDSREFNIIKWGQIFIANIDGVFVSILSSEATFICDKRDTFVKIQVLPLLKESKKISFAFYANDETQLCESPAIRNGNILQWTAPEGKIAIQNFDGVQTQSLDGYEIDIFKPGYKMGLFGDHK